MGCTERERGSIGKGASVQPGTTFPVLAENMNESMIERLILEAVTAGDAPRVRSLIAGSAARLGCRSSFGTWLHLAAGCGRVEVVRELLGLGADVNVTDPAFGGAPINLAAAGGHLEVVKALIDAGAGFDTSEAELNPLFSAVFGGHFEVVRLLIEDGIDHRVCYTGEFMKDMDAEAFACECGRPAIASYLSELKSRLDEE